MNNSLNNMFSIIEKNYCGLKYKCKMCLVADHFFPFLFVNRFKRNKPIAQYITEIWLVVGLARKLVHLLWSTHRQQIKCLNDKKSKKSVRFSSVFLVGIDVLLKSPKVQNQPNCDCIICVGLTT